VHSDSLITESMLFVPKLSLVFLLVCIFFNRDASSTDFPTVRVSTSLGEIEGTFLETETGLQFPAFRGIPYAKPPIGELRFKKPEPAEKWVGVLDATKDGPACPQQDAFSRWYFGEEDCLLLNVYTPQLPTKGVPSKKPVMVWIHGGGFFWGSGRSDLYGPAKLLNHDVVLVTINYRLGPFGFMSTGDEVAPGNYGLWDQVEALRWVKANIRYFGGDPDKVTIFGESAGGFSVGLMLVSPPAKGLFHKAISQSGSATCMKSEGPEDQKKRAAFLARKAGCPTESSQELIDCLRRIPAADLITYHVPSKITAETGGVEHFFPVIDGELLITSPLTVLKSGDFNKVPFMAGTTENEGEFFTTFFQPTKESLMLIVKPWLKLMGLSDPGLEEELMQRYLPNPDTMDEAALRNAYSDLFDDILITTCTNKTAMEVAEHVPTYVYRFDHSAKHSVFNIIFNKEIQGVPHYDDMPYLFNMPVFGFPKFTGNDREVQERFLKFWTNFAKTGSPATDNRWDLFKPSESSAGYYRFSTDAMDDVPFSKNQEFYDNLVENAEPFEPRIRKTG